MQCEQCLYRYSFRRALYAQILRSALVLHLLTLVSMLLLLVTLAGAMQLLDAALLDGAIANLKRSRTLAKFLGLDGVTRKSLRRLRDSHVATWLVDHVPHDFFGLDSAYVVSALLLIGLSGFLSLGVIGPMLWQRDDPIFFLLIVVAIGVSRSSLLLYGRLKRISARLLSTAERMVVNVQQLPHQGAAIAAREARELGAPEAVEVSAPVAQAEAPRGVCREGATTPAMRMVAPRASASSVRSRNDGCA